MFKLFSKPKAKTYENVTTYNEWDHNGWGNSIIMDWEREEGGIRITGFHGHRRGINEGDIIRVKMHKGIYQFRIDDIEYMNDPTDMFFVRGFTTLEDD